MPNPIVVFGLSGTGKSFVARLISEKFGYRWLRSDEIRKELAGIKPSQSAKAPFGEGIYTQDMTERVYREMINRAKELVRSGEKVVLDATFLKRWQRDLVKKNFEKPLFILVTASDDAVRKRLEKRVDVSDADFSVYLKQKEVFEPPEEVSYVELNTERPSEEVLSILKDLIKD